MELAGIEGHIHLFEKPDGTRVPAEKKLVEGRPLAERNLEDFVVQQLESIEPGLHMVERQQILGNTSF